MLTLLASAILGLTPLHDAGFRGEGITIAVIDGGFFRANEESVFPQDHILSWHDLVLDDRLQGDTCVADSIGMFSDPNNCHGSYVLSTMLYESPQFCGTAPDAHYILIRTEDMGAEYPGEAERLARGIRLAEELGADIITSSLGYSEFDDPALNYSYQQMDGSTVSSRAATEAVRHGLFVCVSAGNSGNKAWHYISAPADADSILAVGAVAQDSLPAAFSSYGPSADGRLKPDVAAWGQRTTIFYPNLQDSLGNYVGGLSSGNGTSFACPEVAGMVACLMQALPHLSVMELRDYVLRSSHLYDSVQYAMANPELHVPIHPQLGYGIPNAWLAYQLATNGTSTLEEALCHTPAEDSATAQKFFHAGHLYIRRSNRLYTPSGQLIVDN